MRLMNSMRSTLVLVLSLLVAPLLRAAGTPLEPMTPLVPWNDYGPMATAFAGGRFLTVWGSPYLLGALSDGAGNRISPEPFPIIQGSWVQTFAVAGVGDHFALLWRDTRGQVQFAEIDRDGKVTRRLALALPWLEPGLAWNGTHFLVFGRGVETNAMESVLLDRDGRILTNPVPLGNPAAVQHVLVRRDGTFVLLVASPTSLRAVEVTRQGTLGKDLTIEQTIEVPENFYIAGSAAALESSDGRLLVAFVRYPFASLKTAIVATSGAVSEPLEIPAGDSPNISNLHIADQDGPVIYFVRTTTLVASLVKRDLEAVRVGADGHAVNQAPIVISPTPFLASYATNGRLTLAAGGGFSYALTRPEPVSPQPLNLSPTVQPVVRAGANGIGILAAWEDRTNNGVSVHLASVDRAGRRTSPITVLSGKLAGRIASGPTDHLVLRDDYPRASNITADSIDDRLQPPPPFVTATRVDREGRVLERISLGDYPFEADAVWTGAGYLIAVSSAGRLSVQYGAGTPREITLPLVSDRHQRSIHHLQIAFDGKVALLTWLDWVTEICCWNPSTSIAMMRLTAPGEPIDAAPLTFKTDVIEPHILAGGDGEFLLISPTDSTLRVVRSQTAGLTSTAHPYDLGSYRITNVTWTGNDFIAAIAGPRRYAGAARIDRSGRITEQRAVRAGDWTSAVDVASNGTSEIIVASVANDFAPYRAVALTPSELGVIPPPPPPVSYEVTPLSAEWLRISWKPVPGADGYEIEAVRDGQIYPYSWSAGPEETSFEIRWVGSYRWRVRAVTLGGYSVDGSSGRNRTVRR